MKTLALLRPAVSTRLAPRSADRDQTRPIASTKIIEPRTRAGPWSSLLILALLGAATLAPAQSAYTLTDLGVLPGHTGSFATAVNASGQVVGYCTNQDSTTIRSFIYADGRMTDLGTLGGLWTMALGLNASGQVVGGSLLSIDNAHGFLYSSGRMTDLGVLAGTGTYSWATGINSAGQIVGESGEGGLGRFHAFLYANGQMRDLGTLGGNMSSAACINDAGQIAGRSELSASFFGAVYAFLYSGNRMISLGTLGGSGSWARGINASGQVVGGSYLGSSGGVPAYNQHAFLYANGRMTDLGTLPPFDSSEANGINATGQVVGEVFNYYESNDPDVTSQRAFLYTGGRMYDLNHLVIGAPGWTLLQAAAINDNGAIAGFGLTPAGDTHAFLLTPSTQPLPPVVTTPPATQHVAPASRATFSVATIGSNLTYQWKKNGAAIPGATTTTYTIASATPGDMGFYSVTVTSGGGSVESGVAALTLAASPTYSYTTLAGARRAATGGDSVDGTGPAAFFHSVWGVAVDNFGQVFVTDGSTIRRISASGVVTTLAGVSGSHGSVDGVGSAARLWGPTGLALDTEGNLFFSEGSKAVIRKVTPAGVVTTIAGAVDVTGWTDGPVATARFNRPMGLAVDANSNIFVADTGNSTIRKISANGIVSTIAGRVGIPGSSDGIGSGARLMGGMGLAIDAKGNLFDASSTIVRKISPTGVVTTVAGLAGAKGSADGIGGAARFEWAHGVAVDKAGNVFVADRANHTIRRIAADGTVTTVGGLAGASGRVEGVGSAARFNQPLALAVDASGNLYIADIENSLIRKGTPSVDLPTSRLVNISTRGSVPAGGALTPGFVLRGNGAKSLVARAVGPTLLRFGVGGALADPVLELIGAGTSTVLLSNDNWGTASAGPALLSTTAAVGAFALDAGSRDAATLATLNTATTGAGYSVRITSGNATASGLVLAEVYDADPLTAPVQIVNVSTLGTVGTGADNLVSGFVIGGTAAKQLLIRAVGPGLAAFGVTGALADPRLTVTPLGQSFTVAGNDNWDAAATAVSAFTQAGAFALEYGSKDAALLVRLPPGGYTVTVSGAGTTTGTALVEIYDLDP